MEGAGKSHMSKLEKSDIFEKSSHSSSSHKLLSCNGEESKQYDKADLSVIANDAVDNNEIPDTVHKPIADIKYPKIPVNLMLNRTENETDGIAKEEEEEEEVPVEK